MATLKPVAQSESNQFSNDIKPNIMMVGYQYLWLKPDDDYVWRFNPSGQKSLLLTFLNNATEKRPGCDAKSVRAQVTFEWDTGAPGPNFSPVPWLNEESAFVDIPLGVEKKLVIGSGRGPQEGWYGYKSNRVNSNWTKGVNPLESDPIPDRGKMRVRIIASIDGRSEVLWMACFSWKIEFNPNHPWFEQISCDEIEAYG